MSNTFPHPVIIDNVPEAAPFLPYLQSKGYSISLIVEGGWITATLVGTKRVWSYYGDGGIEPFSKQGKTKAEAIANLREWCSGQKHHPKARERWFSTYTGPEEQFPPFVA